MARRLRPSDLRTTDLGDGFGVLWSSSVTLDDPELDYVVSAKVDEIEGRLEVRDFTVSARPGGPSVTADAVKRLPIARLVRHASNGLGLVEADHGGIGPVDTEQLRQLPAIEAAALVYRAAYLLGLDPTRTVADELGLTYDAAAKRVQTARRSGLLGSASPGRKGA